MKNKRIVKDDIWIGEATVGTLWLDKDQVKRLVEKGELFEEKKK